MAKLNLRDLHKERAGDPLVEERNKGYALHRKYYRGEAAGEDIPSYWTRGNGGKPLHRDEQGRQAPVVVNQVSQIVNHFTSMFGRIPHVRVLPYSARSESLILADKLTAYIVHVFNRSRLKAAQVQQAQRFSLDGDAVYSVEWDDETTEIFVRTWNPAWCYPTFADLDIGGVEDILVSYKVHRRWAEKTFGTRFPGKEQMLDYYLYWDQWERHVQVGDVYIDGMYANHDLGFCPFRWAFSRPTGEFGSSDVKDIILLQDAYNEIVKLMFDALRKNIEKSYWGKGLRGDLTPIPGKVLALNNPAAEINEFPAAEPPAVAMNVLGQLANDIAKVGGISPISMEGTAPGSIVTGVAVRHQVQAIESRAETKRIMMEGCFQALGEYILKILEAKFNDRPVLFRTKELGAEQLYGREVQGYYDCVANYGQLFSMDPMGRMQMVLQGLGRVLDDRKAIELLDFEDVTPDELVKRVEDYQVRQAGLTARAQALAQQEAQKATEQGGQPGGGQGGPQPAPPEAQQGHPPPSPDQFMQSLKKLQDAIKLIETALSGKVWAVGDIAIAGASAEPVIMVAKPEDLAMVQNVMEQFQGKVVIGSPNGTPAVPLV